MIPVSSKLILIRFILSLLPTFYACISQVEIVSTTFKHPLKQPLKTFSSQLPSIRSALYPCTMALASLCFPCITHTLGRVSTNDTLPFSGRIYRTTRRRRQRRRTWCDWNNFLHTALFSNKQGTVGRHLDIEKLDQTSNANL
jgi:hypothetical protein